MIYVLQSLGNRFTIPLVEKYIKNSNLEDIPKIQSSCFLFFALNKKKGFSYILFFLYASSD